MTKLGQIAVLMSTAILPSLVKIGLETKEFYQYAKGFVNQDPTVSTLIPHNFQSRIFLLELKFFLGNISSTEWTKDTISCIIFTFFVCYHIIGCQPKI